MWTSVSSVQSGGPGFNPVSLAAKTLGWSVAKWAEFSASPGAGDSPVFPTPGSILRREGPYSMGDGHKLDKSAQ